jgi:transposase
VTQTEIAFAEIPVDKMDLLSREDLIALFRGEQSLRRQMECEVTRLRAMNELLKQKSFLIQEQLVTIKDKIYGKSSEKSPKVPPADASTTLDGVPKPKNKRVLLPSERYPDADLIVRDITLDQTPSCACCGNAMRDTGMTEDSEFLTVIPKQYIVIRQKRHKYACGKCHGNVKTAPGPMRIKPGSGFSDEMMIDVAMTKYCDLIPIERYSAMAGREGLQDLPPQSLIETTHYLAEFIADAYRRLKLEITSSLVLHADETPHRMLEGDKRHSWFLWGFSTPSSSYFECHSSRSGDVAKGILKESKCLHLVSDVYSGYSKSVRETNQEREAEGSDLRILHVYCNAHARRYFKQALDAYPDEAQVFVDQYEEIYRLNKLAKDKPPGEILALRYQMRIYYDEMKARAMSDVRGFSEKSSIAKAMNYFLKNFDGLTRFLDNADLPIDNNPQERLLRNPVIGRKTWYGTHSKLGAKTASVMFSVSENCKLNQVNPREYLKRLVDDLHAGKPAFTPAEFKHRLATEVQEAGSVPANAEVLA